MPCEKGSACHVRRACAAALVTATVAKPSVFTLADWALAAPPYVKDEEIGVTAAPCAPCW